jgi:O-Antigen ligase
MISQGLKLPILKSSQVVAVILLAVTIGAITAVNPIIALGLSGAALFLSLAVDIPSVALIIWLVALGLFPSWISLHIAGGNAGATGITVLLTDLFLLVRCVTRSTWSDSRLRILWLLFIGGVFLSLVGHHGQNNIFWAVQLLLLGPIAFIVGSSLTKSEYATLLTWLLRIGSVVATLAIIQLVTKLNPYDQIGLHAPTVATRGEYTRAALSFGTPLALGGFLALTFAVALWQRHYRFAILLGAGVLATVSRGPILASCVALIVFAISSSSQHRISPRRLASVIVIFSLLLVLPGSFPRFLRTFLTESANLAGQNAAANNTRGRAELLQGGIRATLTEPVTGHGIGTASSGRSTYVQVGTRDFSDITNEYLSLSLEGGILLIAGLLSVLVVLFFDLRRSAAVAVIAAQAVVWFDVGAILSLPLFFLIAGALWRNERASLALATPLPHRSTDLSNPQPVRPF